MPARFISDRFVGRERELSRLAVALEAAAEGRSPRILLAGSGGIGVSRLVSETIRRVERLDGSFRVVRCRAVPAHAAAAYAPIAEGLGRWLATLDDAELQRIVGPGAEPLARLLPDLAPRLGYGADAPRPRRREAIAPERRTAWLNEAIHGLLARSGEDRPVLLVLEDLHHADAGTRGLATFLARVTRPARLCLVATYGSDRLARGHLLLPELAAMAQATDPPDRLELGLLDRRELAQLVAEIEGERPTAAALLLVAERSAGIPLVAEEVLAARRELPGVALGSSLEELILARVALRGPECRRVLRLLALAGMPLTRETMAVVDATYEVLTEGIPPRSTTRPRRGDGVLHADLRAGLEEGIGHGFVVEAPDGRVEIRHELVGRAIESDLLPATRRRHRLALASALERAHDASAALTHWLAAHESARARSAAIVAATDSERLDSAADALAARELALELGPGSASERANAGHLLYETATVALAAGRPDRAMAYLESALARFGERADAELSAELHEMLGRVARTLGDHDRALAEHRRAVSIVPPEDSVGRARILGSLAQTLMLLGLFQEADAVGRDAIAVARRAGPEARGIEAHALCTVGVAQAWGASGEAGIALLRSARELARELSDPDVGFRATLNLSTSLSLLGRRDEAISITEAAIDDARRDGLEVAYGNPLRGNIAEALFNAGRWVEARETIRTALEWSPDPVAFADASVTAAMLEVETSVDERAASLLGWRPLQVDHAPDPQLEVPATRAAASFALWRGDVADARRAAERGWTLVRRAEDWALTARMAATYLEVQAAAADDARERRALPEVSGARQRARRVLAETDAVIRASGISAGSPGRLEADANLATARAFGARLESRDDPVLWDAAAQAWERAREPYHVAKARWHQAEATLPGHDARVGRAAARGPLLQAVRIARELEARPLQRALEGLARRALINVPAAPGATATAAAPATAPASGAPSTTPLPGPAPAGVPVMASPIAAAFAGAASDGRPEPAFGLSNREREVLSLIVEGRTNREIGERLFISQKTVGVHVGNILAKLGVSGRVEAAMVAVRLELVPPPAGVSAPGPRLAGSASAAS
ncbi:MAG TPA: AAA family ATPase [Candidatus Limnocylindrales bacterium]|nr:AAA family ATPase [Candidatus Limnocylindrales bacterium]